MCNISFYIYVNHIIYKFKTNIFFVSTKSKQENIVHIFFVKIFVENICMCKTTLNHIYDKRKKNITNIKWGNELSLDSV